MGRLESVRRTGWMLMYGLEPNHTKDFTKGNECSYVRHCKDSWMKRSLVAVHTLYSVIFMTKVVQFKDIFSITCAILIVYK